MDSDTYQVVTNDEDQYSIWLADRAPPAGWSPRGVSGTREHCLEYIRTHWTDMRPASLRKAMLDRSQTPTN